MSPARILVVDDDHAAASALRGALTEAGFSAVEAASARQARQRLATQPIDYLVTKLLMSDGDAIELITLVKADRNETRIIVISDRRFLYGLDLFDVCRKLGVDAVLDASSGIEAILAAIVDCG
jgi:DNA-binding NtrC family response regulator